MTGSLLRNEHSAPPPYSGWVTRMLLLILLAALTVLVLSWLSESRNSPAQELAEPEIETLGAAAANFDRPLAHRTDPGVLASAASLVLVVTLAASWLPAWRASRVDPMAALRYE